MSIFNPISWFHHKDPEKDNLKKQQSDAFGSLSGISNFGVGQAKQLGAKGNEIQDEATKYFQSLLGTNNLGETLSAPAVNATRDAADAATRQEATMGTGRSGGAVAANQQQQSDVMGKISSLLQGGNVAALQLKDAAGGHLGEISGQDLQAMLSALGISSGASGTLGQLSTAQLMEKDQASKELWGSLIKGIASIAAAA